MTVKWWSLLVALAFCSIHSTVITGTEAVRLDLRPVPSNDPDAIPDLIELPNPALDPRPADLNVTALMAKLGTKFEANYMSYAKPVSLNSLFDIPFRRNRRGRLVPTGEMPDYIRDLDTKYFTLADGRKLKTRIPQRLRRKIQQYAWGKTYCPLERRWKDLGQRFWPRWLLEGHCPKGESSCSIPDGMYCRATANQYKTLLRWHCRGSGPSAVLHQYNSLPGTKTPGTIGAAKVCQWIKVEYPVVTKCGCSCTVVPD